jgi:hypothetical protein
VDRLVGVLRAQVAADDQTHSGNDDDRSFHIASRFQMVPIGMATDDTSAGATDGREAMCNSPARLAGKNQ